MQGNLKALRRPLLALAFVAAACSGEDSESALTGQVTARCGKDVSCAALDDGNACNGSLRCDLESGQCKLDVTTVVACDPKDDTACVRAACDPLTGACAQKPTIDGLHCDDGDPCTSGDHCKVGACAPGAVVVCECKSDADCPDADDNLCTGVSYCDKAAAPFRCRPKPASAITCKEDLDPCTIPTCDPQSGDCKPLPIVDGGVCDDGNACTKGDQCLKGVCSGGAETCKCKVDGDCEDDGNLCNGTQFCDKSDNGGTCKPNPATIVACNDQADTACLKNACVPSLGTCKLSATNEGKTCDDANTCTTGETCVGGACTAGTDTCKCNTNADCASKEDGNICNGTMFCNKQTGGCELNPATIVTCPTVNDTACAKNVCVPATGKCEVFARAAVNQVGCQAVDLGGGIVAQFCLFAPPAAGTQADPGPFGCEDGEKCTKGDVCEGKACKPGEKVCDCATNADCAIKDDGNLCNGTMFCDAVAGKCAVNPATVITCQSVDDTACSKNTCNPKSGQCAFVVQASGTPCDDSDACTSGDTCAQGKCAAGKFTCECNADADCIDVDGDLCTGTYYCDKSGTQPACKLNPKSVVVCLGADDTACLKNVCNPKLGTCQPTVSAPGTVCDDGDACTKGDVCKLGSCVPGIFACECKTDTDCAAKDDGNLCNGTLFCDKSGAAPACKPKPNSVVTCPSVDDTQCSKNICNVKSGACAFVDLQSGTKCEDGDLCTAGDSCYQGKCTAGLFTCACKSDSDCLSKEDGNFCNGTLFCDTTGTKPACKVKASTLVSCPSVDDTPCLKNTCQAKTGDCQPAQVAPNTPCTDGDACTTGDLCKLGVCTPGAFTCACKADADCATKDDGNLCNGIQYCDKSGAAPACKPLPNSSVFCSKLEDTACLKAQCEPKTAKCALQPVTAGTPCDDGKFCQVETTCSAGACAGGKTNPCSDGDPCTTDACAALTGCVHTAVNCSDGNSCTQEACDVKTGACTKPVAAASGAPCNADADGCTVGDVCNASGACGAGSPVVCPISTDPCQNTSCLSKLGGTDYACAPVGALDGKPCDDGASCNIGAACAAGKCAPGKVSRLFAKYVGSASVAHELAAVLPDADGTVTAGGWQSGAGQTRRPWLVQFDALGNQTAEWSSTSDQASSAVGVRGIFASGTDGLLVVGTEVDSTGKPTTVARRFGPNLAPIGGAITHRWNAKYDEPMISVGFYTGAKVSLAIQPSDPANPGQALAPMLIRLSTDGTANSQWQTIYMADTAPVATAVVVRTPFAFAFGKGPSWTVHGQTIDEPVIAQDNFGGTADVLGAGQFTADAGLTMSLLLSTTAASKTKLQLAIFDNEQFSGLKLRSVTDDFLVKDSVVVDGRILAVGERKSMGEILALDMAGNVRQATPLAPPNAGGTHKLLAVAPATLGGVWAVGSQQPASGARRALLVRANAFGHSSCASAGACAELKGSDCADDLPCTTDVCDPKFGCLFTPNAPYCTLSGGCTTIGVCNESKCAADVGSRLWSANHKLGAPSSTAGAFLGMGSGGMLFSSGNAAALYNQDIDLLGQAAGTATDEDFLCSKVTKTLAIVPDPLDVKPALWRLGRDSANNAVFCQRRVTVLAASAQLQAVVTNPCVGCEITPRQAVRQIDGSYVLLSSVNLAADGNVSLKRVTSAGANVWSLDYDAVGFYLAAEDFGQLATLDGFVVGRAGKTVPPLDSAFALLVSESGKVVSFKTYTSDVGRALVAAKPLTPSLVAVGGTVTINNTIRSPWLMGLDAKGATAFEWIAPPEDPPATIEAMAVANSTMVWAGPSLLAGGVGFSVGANNVQGKALWRRDHTIANFAHVLPHTLHAAGGDWVATATSGALGGPVSSVTILRMSPWGHLTCPGAGGCGEPLKSCDDLNPCTADFCEAMLGCQSIPLHGLTCGVGKTCAQSVCK